MLIKLGLDIFGNHFILDASNPGITVHSNWKINFRSLTQHALFMPETPTRNHSATFQRFIEKLTAFTREKFGGSLVEIVFASSYWFQVWTINWLKDGVHQSLVDLIWLEARRNTFRSWIFRDKFHQKGNGHFLHQKGWGDLQMLEPPTWYVPREKSYESEMRS